MHDSNSRKDSITIQKRCCASIRKAPVIREVEHEPGLIATAAYMKDLGPLYADDPQIQEIRSSTLEKPQQ